MHCVTPGLSTPTGTRKFSVFAERLYNLSKSHRIKGGTKTQIRVCLSSIFSFTDNVLLLRDTGLSLSPFCSFTSPRAKVPEFDSSSAGSEASTGHPRTQKARSSVLLSPKFFSFPPFSRLPHMLEIKKLNYLGCQVSSESCSDGLCFDRICNSNLFHGDQVKKKSRNSVLLCIDLLYQTV